jgi:hypothetical protein
MRTTRYLLSIGVGLALVFGSTAAIAVLTRSPAAPASPRSTGIPQIIIDTDLSLWWDDATAIGMANVLEQRRKDHVLAVMSDIPNPTAVAAIDAIDTAYGHADIPLGALADSTVNTAPHGYSDKLADSLPHQIRSSRDVPDAVTLYRRILARQPDHSVTIVAIGSYANLAGLLESEAGDGSELDGRRLIATKVKRTVIEDGFFPNNGVPAFTNQKLDLAAATEVVNGNWPTPISWVDGTTGVATKVGGGLCGSASAKNPMRIVYEAKFGCGPPGDGDWDGPSLLYAVQGPGDPFTELGRGGSAYVNTEGGLSWRADSGRPNDLYVHVADQNALNDEINSLLGAT